MTMTNKAHVSQVRVYYEDTDMAGVVYYANYLKFIERARSDALREAGVDQRAMRDEGVVFVVNRVVADYHAPARYDDVLTIETTALDVRRASATLRQLVTREDTLIFAADVRIACISVEGRALRIPEIARLALTSL
ncbi:MAG: tol-pal system-associated acyl-CoA thioesterase [Pikeienuella sp.]